MGLPSPGSVQNGSSQSRGPSHWSAPPGATAKDTRTRTPRTRSAVTALITNGHSRRCDQHAEQVPPPRVSAGRLPPGSHSHRRSGRSGRVDAAGLSLQFPKAEGRPVQGETSFQGTGWLGGTSAFSSSLFRTSRDPGGDCWSLGLPTAQPPSHHLDSAAPRPAGKPPRAVACWSRPLLPSGAPAIPGSASSPGTGRSADLARSPLNSTPSRKLVLTL